jgi:hypothetical protein
MASKWRDMRNPRVADLPHSGCVRLGIDPDQRDTISGPRARPAARLTSAAVRNGTEIITKAPRDIRTNTIA